MTWNILDAVTEIADTVRGAVGVARVYYASAQNDDRIPPAISEFPSLMVYPESSAPLVSYAGQIRETTVNIDVFSGRWDIGFNVAETLRIIEAVIGRLHSRVVLTPTARWVRYTPLWLVPLDWGGIIYAGGRVIVEINEDEQVVLTP